VNACIDCANTINSSVGRLLAEEISQCSGFGSLSPTSQKSGVRGMYEQAFGGAGYLAMFTVVVIMVLL
jgi:hypothetical protein